MPKANPHFNLIGLMCARARSRETRVELDGIYAQEETKQANSWQTHVLTIINLSIYIANIQ